MSELKLDKLLDDNKPIYVLNNSNPRGILVISLVHPTTGNVTPIKIPVTWVPICVTDHVPPEQLRDSLDFRGYLRKGIIKLVDPDKAEKILASKEAKEELERINKSEFADRFDVSVKAMGSNDASSEINPKVMDIVLRLESQDITANDALNQLKSIYTTLSKQDLAYIAQNATESIAKWAERMLTKSE